MGGSPEGRESWNASPGRSKLGSGHDRVPKGISEGGGGGENKKGRRTCLGEGSRTPNYVIRRDGREKDLRQGRES